MKFNNNKRGQVGIGTLIVFIAMVLVAAIAAGVLVNTAGFLQETAEQTGEQSQAQVSDRIEVVQGYGLANQVVTQTGTNAGDKRYVAGAGTDFNSDTFTNEDDVRVHELNFVMKRTAGAGDINLQSATINWIGPEGAHQMRLDSNYVDITPISGGANDLLTSNSDRVRVTLKLGGVYDGSAFQDALTTETAADYSLLKAGDDFTITFTTESGASTTVKGQLPTVLQDGDVVEL